MSLVGERVRKFEQKLERLQRLRRRLEHAAAANSDPVLVAIIKGVLDLLEDEL